MSQWFYAEGNQDRRGPIPDEDLVELFRSGRIALDTLVWREGMGDWLPLSALASELGLTELPTAAASAGGPPTLPPLSGQTAPAFPDTAAPPKRKSGCLIVGIIAGVCALIAVPVIGILAAIALPAYQDYTLRAKTNAAYLHLSALEAGVDTFVTEHERCPVNDDDGFGSPESYAGSGIGAVRIGRFDNGHCGMEGVLDIPGSPKLDGKSIWLDYDSDTAQWECTAEPDDKYLPQICRG